MKKRILKKKAKRAIMNVFKIKTDQEFLEWIRNPVESLYSEPLLNLPAGVFSVNYAKSMPPSFTGIAF